MRANTGTRHRIRSPWHVRIINLFTAAASAQSLDHDPPGSTRLPRNEPHRTINKPPLGSARMTTPNAEVIAYAAGTRIARLLRPRSVIFWEEIVSRDGRRAIITANETAVGI